MTTSDVPMQKLDQPPLDLEALKKLAAARRVLARTDSRFVDGTWTLEDVLRDAGVVISLDNFEALLSEHSVLTEGVEKAEALMIRWRIAAQRWTPGGSEFMDPKSCEAFIAAQRQDHTKAKLEVVRQTRRAEAAEASNERMRKALEESEARTRAIIAAYDAAIHVTVGDGGRRSWKMNAGKLAKAFDLARSAAQGDQGAAQSRAGIYVASRASIPERSRMWRHLRDACGYPITASWIDEAGEGETADQGELWTRILSEVTSAKGLVFYAEPGDFPLKGAYVEIGMALAAGVPVAVVAPDVEIESWSCRPIGSWMRHPLVRNFNDVTVAISELLAPLPSPPEQGGN